MSKRAPARITPLVAALGAALVLASAIASWGWLRPSPPAGDVTRVALSLPAGQEIQPQFWGFSFDVSPDGSRVAYVGPGPTRATSQVWIRPLDALEATAVAGTTGALGVQWAPDAHALLVMTSRPNSRVQRA